MSNNSTFFIPHFFIDSVSTLTSKALNQYLKAHGAPNKNATKKYGHWGPSDHWSAHTFS